MHKPEQINRVNCIRNRIKGPKTSGDIRLLTQICTALGVATVHCALETCKKVFLEDEDAVNPRVYCSPECVSHALAIEDARVKAAVKKAQEEEEARLVAEENEAKERANAEAEAKAEEASEAANALLTPEEFAAKSGIAYGDVNMLGRAGLIRRIKTKGHRAYWLCEEDVQIAVKWKNSRKK